MCERKPNYKQPKKTDEGKICQRYKKNKLRVNGEKTRRNTKLCEKIIILTKEMKNK